MDLSLIKIAAQNDSQSGFDQINILLSLPPVHEQWHFVEQQLRVKDFVEHADIDFEFITILLAHILQMAFIL